MYLARVLPVPVGDEVVELSLDDLPSDIEDYVQVLREERCPAPFWLKLASECGARKRIKDCEAVLLSAIQTLTAVPPPDMNHYRSQQAIAEEIAPFHAMLATLQLSKARQLPKMLIKDAKYQNLTLNQPGIQPKEQWMSAAALHSNAIIFPPPPTKGSDPSRQPVSLRSNMYLGRAIYLLNAGKTDEASKTFDVVLQRQNRNPIALLGKACCLLRRRTYIASLKLYQEVLAISIAQTASAAGESAIVGPDGELVESQAHKWLGPDARIGIGLCLHGMGRINEAQRAWARAAVVNPSNPSSHLLLGLSKTNMAKQMSAIDAATLASYDGSESAARAALYKEGIAHIQTSWKLDNKSAMAAAALAEHFCVRATDLGTTDKVKAQQEFERALKLAEHAIQYADNLAAVNQARLTFARTAHLYSYLDETSTATIELRAQAQRYYSRVAEDLGRSTANTDLSSLSQGHALAVLGLTQLQASRGEILGAMNTAETILARPASVSSACIELSLFAASLRAHSHPGATAAERISDRQRARLILERTMRSIGACALLSGVEDDLDDGLKVVDELISQTEGTTSSSATEAADLAFARTALAKENLGRESVRDLARLAEDELNFIQLADLFRDVNSGIPDFLRSAGALLSALKAIRRRKQDIDQEGLQSSVDASEKESLALRLRANLGATLAIRGIEYLTEDPSYITSAITQMQETLNLAAKAVSTNNLDAEKTVTLFNLGRTLEASANLEDAQKAYEAVLATHPEYVDAKVRLALLTVCKPQARGNREATHLGNALLKEALSSDPGNLDTRSAYVCFLAGDLPASPNPPQWNGIKETIAQVFMGPKSEQAIRIFGSEDVAKRVGDEARHDAFTLASLAWAYYNLGHSVQSGKPNSAEEKQRALLRCSDLLDKALTEDSRCTFAVQGLAVLSAEGTLIDLSSPEGVPDIDSKRKRGAEEAINMLTKLREVNDDASVHICTGHAYMVREDYERALRSYELAARRSRTQAADDINSSVSSLLTAKPSLLQYLARASFLLGMQNKSYAILKSSIEYLQQAVKQLQERASSGAVMEGKFIRYNIAVTRHKVLQMLFDLPLEERQLSILQEAADSIVEAQETFKELLPEAQAKKLHHVGAEVVEQRILYGESSLKRSAQKNIEEQKSYEERIQKEKDAIAARQRERQEAVEKELMEREAQRRQQAEEIEEERKRRNEEIRAWEYVEVEEAKKKSSGPRSTANGSRKKKGKRRNRMEEGGSEIESEDDDQKSLLDSDDGMVVDDDAEVEQGEFSEEEVLGRAVDSGEEDEGNGDANGDRRAKLRDLSRKRAGANGEKKKRRSTAGREGKSEKRSRKSRTRVDSEDEGGEEDGEEDSRPSKKPKKGRMRRAVEEDLIESEEEV
ncbi:hypothetical protein L7F22_043539 [Adiantum nelumboides]|nr:hypothetical protein [Adiantum nelumboides]